MDRGRGQTLDWFLTLVCSSGEREFYLTIINWHLATLWPFVEGEQTGIMRTNARTFSNNRPTFRYYCPVSILHTVTGQCLGSVTRVMMGLVILSDARHQPHVWDSITTELGLLLSLFITWCCCQQALGAAAGWRLVWWLISCQGRYRGFLLMQIRISNVTETSVLSLHSGMVGSLHHGTGDARLG